MFRVRGWRSKEVYASVGFLHDSVSGRDRHDRSKRQVASSSSDGNPRTQVGAKHQPHWNSRRALASHIRHPSAHVRQLTLLRVTLLGCPIFAAVGRCGVVDSVFCFARFRGWLVFFCFDSALALAHDLFCGRILQPGESSRMEDTPLKLLENEVVNCRRCPRLVDYRERIGREKRRAYLGCEYWARPVPGFGDPQARVLVFGLAPGAHGSNRTGRPFTGDASGKFMYPVLHRLGFASQPNALHRDDGMELRNLWISAAVRCAPPDNKPLPSELANCAEYTARELAALKSLKVVVALGKIAFDAYLDTLLPPVRHRPQNRLPLRPRRRIPHAQRHHPACLLPSIQPEHRHRKTHHPHVRSRLPPRPRAGHGIAVRSPSVRAGAPTPQLAIVGARRGGHRN